LLVVPDRNEKNKKNKAVQLAFVLIHHCDLVLGITILKCITVAMNRCVETFD